MLPKEPNALFFFVRLFRRTRFGPIKKQLRRSGAEPVLFIKPRLKMLLERADKSAAGWGWRLGVSALSNNNPSAAAAAMCCRVFNKTNKPHESRQTFSQCGAAAALWTHLASCLHLVQVPAPDPCTAHFCVSAPARRTAQAHPHTHILAKAHQLLAGLVWVSAATELIKSRSLCSPFH